MGRTLKKAVMFHTLSLLILPRYSLREICPSVERNYSGCESVNKAGAIDMAGYSFSSHFLPSLLDKSQVSIAVGPV